VAGVLAPVRPPVHWIRWRPYAACVSGDRFGTPSAGRTLDRQEALPKEVNHAGRRPDSLMWVIAILTTANLGFIAYSVFH
jgi:hypothetical protein